ncbi:hypothetical protein BT96DRAFT_473144 [Gymnopus androsaceus JB14]|uniref:Uncharacterized protein n=1 Tax=Gymnopus androsaceus JB14 TaxID=1447944 RepID=A0A6A4I4K4_9AGAR|nr:hypothetical protein BT96DRAFT_473144 [Gymnopus androsaceus JB14]
MFSLGNKNKKKGYKHALAPSTTQKKVFSTSDASSVNQEQEEAESIPLEVLDGPLPPSTSIFTSARPRVVPPSELESLGKLPKNMFVTSVDVEEGLWNNSKKKKRRKQQQQDVDYTPLHNGESYDTEEAMVLDYGDAEGDHTETIPDSGLGGAEIEETKSTLIWSVVENTFDALPLADFRESFEVGKLVAWKALALNPKTFSPEVLLHIATVTGVSDSHSESAEDFPAQANSETVSICRLIRPGWEDLDVEGVEGTYELENIRAMGWRIVDEVHRT